MAARLYLNTTRGRQTPPTLTFPSLRPELLNIESEALTGGTWRKKTWPRRQLSENKSGCFNRKEGSSKLRARSELSTEKSQKNRHCFASTLFPVVNRFLRRGKSACYSLTNSMCEIRSYMVKINTNQEVFLKKKEQLT